MCEETWFALDPSIRSQFTKRLNRGVVWETISSLLSDAENLTLLPGMATAIRHTGRPTPRALPDLEVEYKNYKGVHPLPAGLVIDATGFDSWAFEALTPPDVRTELVSARRDAMINEMREDLSLPIAGFPRIHAPGLADAQGPGFGSLMVLGAMADKILSPYYDAAKP